MTAGDPKNRPKLELGANELGTSHPRSVRLVAAPPAVPLALARRKSSRDDDTSWIARLSPEARAVLESARGPAPRWPLAPRVPGAVAIPLAAAGQ